MSIENFYNYTEKPSEEYVTYFYNIFCSKGTDKAIPHTYHRIYSALFKDLTSVKDILEIGIYQGASLRAWSEIFPNSKIVGLDIDTTYFVNDERIKSFWADQNSKESFKNVFDQLENPSYNLILDDGYHGWHETYNTFQVCLEKLKIGGWYIIEDIKTIYEQRWESISNNLSEEYVSFMVNMNSGVYDIQSGLEMSDNTVLAIQRIK